MVLIYWNLLILFFRSRISAKTIIQCITHTDIAITVIIFNLEFASLTPLGCCLLLAPLHCATQARSPRGKIPSRMIRSLLSSPLCTSSSHLIGWFSFIMCKVSSSLALSSLRLSLAARTRESRGINHYAFQGCFEPESSSRAHPEVRRCLRACFTCLLNQGLARWFCDNLMCLIMCICIVFDSLLCGYLLCLL